MGYINRVSKCKDKLIFIWSSIGRKRTSGVSHNKNSKTYKSSNRSVPLDSQTQSIKDFFTATQPIEELDEMEVRNAFDVSNFK